MSATAKPSAGSSAGGGSGDPGEPGEPGSSHAYFQAIEETFVRLRGAPLLLSPADWQVASGWHREGVPLALVLSTLEEFFARRLERAARGKVQSLRYCAAAVDAAWERVRELRSADAREPAPQLDLAARLASLAASLPERLPGRDRLAAAIERLSGSPSVVEEALVGLDERALAAAEERLTPAEQEVLRAEAEVALGPVSDRLSPSEAAAARDRLVRRALRRHLGLPVLSLFAPQAGDSGTD